MLKCQSSDAMVHLQAAGSMCQRVDRDTKRLGIVGVGMHIAKMSNHPIPRLLLVTVTPQEPALWKWHISEANVELIYGYATSRETAQADGNSALFAMLSKGVPRQTI
jgi:hypothetical protein